MRFFGLLFFGVFAPLNLLCAVSGVLIEPTQPIWAVFNLVMALASMACFRTIWLDKRRYT